MWRSKDKSRAWWFQNLPHSLQNRHQSCCQSRHQSCSRSRRRRILGLPAPLFCPARCWRSPRSPQCTWTTSSFALRKKPCLPMAGIAGVRQLGTCVHVRLPPPSRRRTSLFHGAPRKTHRGGTLGRLHFINAEPHSLSGGSRQNRGRQMGTWPRGLLLA
jgi:hypothetical protein